MGPQTSSLLFVRGSGHGEVVQFLVSSVSGTIRNLALYLYVDQDTQRRSVALAKEIRRM